MHIVDRRRNPGSKSLENRQFVTRKSKASATSLPPWLLRLLPVEAVAGWDLHPLDSAAFAPRTPNPGIPRPTAFVHEADIAGGARNVGCREKNGPRRCI